MVHTAARPDTTKNTRPNSAWAAADNRQSQSRNCRERVISREIPGKALLGYLNNKDGVVYLRPRSLRDVLVFLVNVVIVSGGGGSSGEVFSVGGAGLGGIRQSRVKYSSALISALSIDQDVYSSCYSYMKTIKY